MEDHGRQPRNLPPGMIATPLTHSLAEPKHLLVGICGDIGSGKDTVADHLVEKHGFRKLPFAHPLKQVCLDVFGYRQDRFFGTQAEKAAEIFPGWTGRKILEHVGSVFREVDSNVWLNLVRREIEDDRAGGRELNRHVIPDVRYRNEIEMIRHLGGEIWRTVRVGAQSERTGHASDEEWRQIGSDWHLEARTGNLVGLLATADLILHGRTWITPQSRGCK